MSYDGEILHCTKCGEIFQGTEPGDECPACGSCATVPARDDEKE